jgi:hypothetical protein
MIGLEINPSPSGVQTPKRKRRGLSEEHRIKISESRQKGTARKHYEKAMGWIDGFPNRAPPEYYAEELREAWRAAQRAGCPVLKPVETAMFAYAMAMAKAKRKT